MDKIEHVVQILKDHGVKVSDYHGEQNNGQITTGKIYIINDMPYFLLHIVVEDILQHQEKLSTFVEQLKALKRKS